MPPDSFSSREQTCSRFFLRRCLLLFSFPGSSLGTHEPEAPASFRLLRIQRSAARPIAPIFFAPRRRQPATDTISQLARCQMIAHHDWHNFLKSLLGVAK